MAVESENFASESRRNLIGMANLGTNLDYADVLEKEVRGRHDIVIVAYAGANMDVAVQKARAALEYHGVASTVALHDHAGDERKVLENAQGVYLAGGNTFGLVANLNGLEHVDGTRVDRRPNAASEPLSGYLKEQAENGVVIMGTSAGLMVMGKDVRTCSDPRSFVRVSSTGREVAITGLDLLGGQITSFHPHYEASMDGELSEYPQVDPKATIMALSNASFITVEGMEMKMHGVGGAIFRHNEPKQSLQAGMDLSSLLK